MALTKADLENEIIRLKEIIAGWDEVATAMLDNINHFHLKSPQDKALQADAVEGIVYAMQTLREIL